MERKISALNLSNIPDRHTVERDEDGRETEDSINNTVNMVKQRKEGGKPESAPAKNAAEDNQSVEQIESLQKQVADLSEKLKDSESRADSLGQENQSLKSQIQGMESTNQKLDQEAIGYESQIQNSKARIEELENEIVRLKQSGTGQPAGET